MRSVHQRLKNRHPGKVTIVEPRRRRTVDVESLPFKACYSADGTGRFRPIIEVRLTFRSDQVMVAEYGTGGRLLGLSTMDRCALPWPIEG